MVVLNLVLDSIRGMGMLANGGIDILPSKPCHDAVTRSLYLRYDFSPVTVRYVETKDCTLKKQLQKNSKNHCHGSTELNIYRVLQHTLLLAMYQATLRQCKAQVCAVFKLQVSFVLVYPDIDTSPRAPNSSPF